MSPIITIDPHDCPLQALKGGQVFSAEVQLIAYPGRERMFYDFPKEVIVLSDPVLVLGKVDEVIHCFFIIGEGDCH